MSGGEYIEISLDEVIKSSDVVAVVKRSQPPYIVKEVPIHEDRQKFPPFKQHISLFEIIDILHKSDNASGATFSDNISLLPGKVLKVLPAAYDTELNLHKRYYLDGAMKTAGINRYKDYDDKLEKSKECIVFLRYNADEKMLEFTAFGSIEALKIKDKVVKYLKK